MIHTMSNELHKDLYFLYNHSHKDSIIDEDFAYYICQMIEENQFFDDSLVVLHSKGGNMKSGTKIAEFLKKKYKNVSYYVPERAGSTATLMALSGDRLYLDESSIVTPCDPQMNTTEEVMIFVNDIRDYLQQKGTGDLSPIDLAKYYSTIEYFKGLVYRLCRDGNADQIICFMLEDVHSHDYLLQESDFKKMSIILGDMHDIPRESLKYIHELIKKNQSMECCFRT